MSTFSLLLGQTSPTQPLLIAAAADLSPLEQQLSGAFEKEIGGPVRFVWGSSGQLSAQIRNGAPYDVFLPASLQYAQQLETTGHLMSGSVVPFARGRLGLWSKDGGIRTLSDLLSEKVKHVAIANPAHAPYGQAARELLESAGLWNELRPKLVYGENVRQAYQFAERGNADAAIVAWSLVASKQAIQLPEKHQPVLQAAGVVARSARAYEGRKVTAWLRSPAGAALLTAGGFQPTGANSRGETAEKPVKPKRTRKKTR